MNSALERARLVLSENKVPGIRTMISLRLWMVVNSLLVALATALKVFGKPGEDLSQKVEANALWACEDGASVSLEFES